MNPPSTIERYAALTEKVDAFFERVAERYGDRMDCSSGCSDCCRARLTVTSIEAAVILADVAGRPLAEREALAARAAASGVEVCAALDSAGRCSIYRARPLVCRSHGVPIRQRDSGGLPVLGACPRNFKDGFEEISADCALDQTTLSTVLAALDAAYSAEIGAEPGRRVDLATMLAGSDAMLSGGDGLD